MVRVLREKGYLVVKNINDMNHSETNAVMAKLLSEGFVVSFQKP